MNANTAIQVVDSELVFIEGNLIGAALGDKKCSKGFAFTHIVSLHLKLKLVI